MMNQEAVGTNYANQSAFSIIEANSMAKENSVIFFSDMLEFKRDFCKIILTDDPSSKILYPI